ncbi:tetratricopeptide repeat protein [candidate division KSB1 bacterium]|nr:tetratricopeptide repeat protein [candidate division KSB1 bacterium]
MDMVAQGMEWSIREQYDQAVALFTQYAMNDPRDPAPHFFLATVWQSKMMDFETKEWRHLFMREIDKTMELCDSLLIHQPHDNAIRFYYASALAYKSFQISREGKIIKGFSLALRAVDILQKIIDQDSTFYDAYLGTGSYLYWRSYLTRHFAWLPFFHDQRATGIAQIERACRNGALSRWAALSNLAWIYIQEKNYDKAVQCAQRGLESFPMSRFFLWPLGDAQFHQQNFQAALSTYSTLLQSVTLERHNNGYNETVLNLKIAACHFQLRNLAMATHHAQRVLTIEADEQVRKRLAEKYAEAARLLDQIKQSDD